MTVWCDDCMYSTLEERNGLTGVSMIARPPEPPEDQNTARRGHQGVHSLRSRNNIFRNGWDVPV